MNKIATAVIIFSLLIISSCQNSPTAPHEIKKASAPQERAPINPKKVLNVGFLAVDGVFNSELIAPLDILQHTIFHTDPGMKTFVVAPDSMPVTTFEGLKIIPDYTFENVPEIDVLVVPSAENSMGSDLENEKLISFVKETGTNAKFVMSLSTAHLYWHRQACWMKWFALLFQVISIPTKKCFHT